MRTLATLLFVLLSGSAAAAPVSVAVEAGPHDAALTSMLIAEVAELTVTSSDAADVRVVLREHEDAYLVRVSDRGAMLAERRVPLADGLDGALRAATLLTTQAVETVRDFDEPLELPPAPAAFTLYGTTGVVTSFWSRPSTPQLGLAVGGGLDLRAFGFGFTFVWMGDLCCERRTTGIAGTAQELVFLLEGTWTFVGWGPVLGRVRVGGGLDRITAEAEPLTFAVAAPSQRSTAIEGVVRGGLSLDVELVRDWVRFGLGVGAWVRIAPLEVSVPPGYGGEGWFSGQIVPFTEARLEVRVF